MSSFLKNLQCPCCGDLKTNVLSNISNCACGFLFVTKLSDSLFEISLFSKKTSLIAYCNDNNAIINKTTFYDGKNLGTTNGNNITFSDLIKEFNDAKEQFEMLEILQ